MNIRYTSFIKKDLLLLFRGPYLYFSLFFALLNVYLCFSEIDGGVLSQRVLNFKTVVASLSFSMIFYIAFVTTFLSNNDNSLKVSTLYNSWSLSKEKIFYCRAISLTLSSFCFIPWLVPSILMLNIYSSMSLLSFFHLVIFNFCLGAFVSSIFTFFSFVFLKLYFHLLVSIVFSLILLIGGEPEFLSLFFNEKIPSIKTPITFFLSVFERNTWGITPFLDILILTTFIYFFGSVLFTWKRRFL